jgi:hypothetical protein
MYRMTLAILCVLCFSGVAAAKVQVVIPSDDSYVDAIDTNANFNAIVLVSGRDDGIPVQRQVYLKFQLPAAGTITKAELRIPFFDCLATDNAIIEHDVFFVSDDNWLESTLTWSNRPAEGANTGVAYFTGPGCEAGSDLVGDVTALVVQEAAGDGVVSLMVRLEPETLPAGETQNLVVWTSSETAMPPELTLTVIPNAPALGGRGTAALGLFFALAGAGLLKRRGTPTA